MTRKRRRLYVLLHCAIGLGSATALTLTAFQDNLVFFRSPSDIAREAPPRRPVAQRRPDPEGEEAAHHQHVGRRNVHPVRAHAAASPDAVASARHAAAVCRARTRRSITAARVRASTSAAKARVKPSAQTSKG